MTLRVRNKSIPAVLIVLLLLIAREKANSAAQDLFDLYNLEIEGEVHGFLTGDFDGNGLLDITVIYSPLSDFNIRYVALYLHKGSSGFNLKADHLAPLPQNAAQLDVADTDGDGRSEIYLIDFDGVSVLNFSETAGFSSPTRLIRHMTVYSYPLFRGIITDRFLFELSDAPGPEIIIPGSKGYVIFERSDNGSYQILNQLSAPIQGRTYGRSIKEFSGNRNSDLSLSLASINVYDGNADGRNDLYLLWDRRLCCYFQDAAGNFPQNPDVEFEFYPAGVKGYMQSRLIDCNRDRRPDLAVSCTFGGITNTETKIRFYISDAGGRIPSRFSKEITLSDSHCNLLINDYDGDGIPELAVPAVELGALAATKMFLTKNADLHLLIYPLKSGMPVDEPARRMKYGFRLNFDDPQPTSEVTVDWSADFNGDNLHDLVFSDGKGKLKFFWGNSEDYLSKKADLEIALDHPMEVHPIQLGGGEWSDIIVEHNLSGKSGRLTVFKNRNNMN